MTQLRIAPKKNNRRLNKPLTAGKPLANVPTMNNANCICGCKLAILSSDIGPVFWTKAVVPNAKYKPRARRWRQSCWIKYEADEAVRRQTNADSSRHDMLTGVVKSGLMSDDQIFAMGVSAQELRVVKNELAPAPAPLNSDCEICGRSYAEDDMVDGEICGGCYLDSNVQANEFFSEAEGIGED